MAAAAVVMEAVAAIRDLIDCGKKCSGDCKCSGYFYNTKTSMCWIAYDLQTLTKVANPTHVGYVKVPNHQ